MTATNSDTAVALAVNGVSKVFTGTQALNNVSLEVKYGEVHGLVGGNGSGKSTLVKILCGVISADEGTIRVGNDVVDATAVKPALAHELGVRVVHQDLAVFPDLSIAENMALGAGYPKSRLGLIGWRETRRRAREQVKRFEIQASPGTLVRDLPVAARTQVAIARALQDVRSDQGVIILDEPTAALPVHEVDLLLAAVKRLAEQGHAVIFISHRLDEVLSVTDRVTVLRDGVVFGEHVTSELTEAELIESILGRRVQEVRGRSSEASNTDPVLVVEHLTAGPVNDVSFEVYPGEVLGIAGLLGSGRSELLLALYGLLPRESGTVTLNGRTVDFGRPQRAIRSGVVMIPEDRPNEGSFQDLTVDENISISVLERYWRGFGFRIKPMLHDARVLRGRFNVKAPSGAVPMRALSGGNQQKAILARWLRRDPAVLLLDEPTQGVDVGARADIYAAIRDVTDKGGSAIVVTSDLEELAQVVDRALVMRNGRILASVTGDDLTAVRLTERIYRESESQDD